MVYPLQEKLHISGMDGRAPSLARRWRLGCEDITFSYAPMLADPDALPQALRLMKDKPRDLIMPGVRL